MLVRRPGRKRDRRQFGRSLIWARDLRSGCSPLSASTVELTVWPLPRTTPNPVMLPRAIFRQRSRRSASWLAARARVLARWPEVFPSHWPKLPANRSWSTSSGCWQLVEPITWFFASFGITVEYSYDSPGLDGTLGAVRRALALLGERFLVLYGDTYLPMDYQAADAAWRASSKPALMTVFRNEGRWDESNVVFCDGVVVKYDKSHRTADMAWIDYGFGGFTASTLDLVDAAETDLAGLQTLLADRGLLCGFEAAERFHEIGTPEALRETDEFLRQLRESKLG